MSHKNLKYIYIITFFKIVEWKKDLHFYANRHLTKNIVSVSLNILTVTKSLIK